MKSLRRIACIAIPVVWIAGSAAASSISVSATSSGSPLAVYTVEESFLLPSGFENASLDITSFSADDRAVLFLNDNIVASTGIFGPGLGSMVLTPDGDNDPFFFQYGNSGPFASITSGFEAGLNILRFVVNNTGQGIFGSPTTFGGPTGLNFAGQVNFDEGVNAIPLPAALPLMAGAVGILGLVGWRRRKEPAV